MKNRLTRLLKVLEWYPRTGAPDVDALAMQLNTTPATIRRDLRDLREAGAFDAVAGDMQPGAQGVLPAVVLAQPPANDGPATVPVMRLAPGPREAASGLRHGGNAALAMAADTVPAPVAVAMLANTDDELVAMYVGARFLAAEGDPAGAEAAHSIIVRIEDQAGPVLLERLAEIDTRYRFGPRGTERRVRQSVNQAITERRVLRMKYRGERDASYRVREVEPLAQFFIHDRWTFFAYCRTAGDIRQFRHERCAEVEITEQYFTDRGGFSLEGFIQQRRRVASGDARGR